MANLVKVDSVSFTPGKVVLGVGAQTFTLAFDGAAPATNADLAALETRLDAAAKTASENAVAAISAGVLEARDAVVHAVEAFGGSALVVLPDGPTTGVNVAPDTASS